jgi:hypothetical protein
MKRAAKRPAAVTALATSAWMLATACGGTTSAGAQDAGLADRGTESEDASSSDAQQDGGASTPCLGSPVTFHLRASEASTSSYCVGRGCSVEWLVLTTERGEALEHALPCIVSCEDCSSTGCKPPICFDPRRLKTEGEHVTWDGRVWITSTSSTCGNEQCAAPTCATPGRYIAKMCASANTVTDAGFCSQSSTSPQTCVEVAFEYPPVAAVEGVLP